MKYPYIARLRHSKEPVTVVGEFSDEQEYCVYFTNPKDIIVINKRFLVKSEKELYRCYDAQDLHIADYHSKGIAEARAAKENLTVVKFIGLT